METLAFLAVVINVLIFSSALALNIFLGDYASYFRLILTVILWAFTIFIVFEKKALKSWELHLPNQILFLLLTSFTVMLAVSAAVSPAPIVATFYSGLTYLSFYPFTYLFLIIRKNPVLTKRILLIFTVLGVLLSLGVIYDTTVGLQNTPFINSKVIAALNEFATIDENGQQRGGFFFPSSTVVYPFLSIGILSIILLSKLFRNNKLNWLAALSIPIIWLGCFFTFSRTPLILCTVFSIYAFIELVIIDKSVKLSHKTILLLVFVIVISLFSEIRDFLYEQAGSYQITRFESTFSQGETGNYTRLMGWQDGLKLFDLLEAWRGYGLGTSNTRMGELYNFPVRSHFESSIFLTFSEGGVVGLFARLLPLVVTFWLCQKTVVSRLFSVWMLLFFVNLCVSPLIDGHSVQVAYFLAMALCLAFAPLLKDRKFNEID